jgi:iron(III) transport system permease protein
MGNSDGESLMQLTQSKPISSRSAPSELLLHSRVRQWLTGEEWLQRLLLALTALWLLIVVVLPLYEMVLRSLVDKTGRFVGLQNYLTYFSTPALSVSIYNSFFVSIVSTLIAVGLGFLFAYAMTRSAMRGKAIFRAVAMLPLYAPSLAHAIALIYLFGNKGILTTGFFGFFKTTFGWDVGLNIGLYGATGIILAEILYCFPQAFLILTVALTLADARLYEAATALRASGLRIFLTVTLPGVKYGLISAIFVCFTLAFTDFGAPKVVGGNYNVLATDIYKQVIGQQNFVMGATVSILLLIPTVIAFLIDRIAQRRQVALIGARAVPLQPRAQPLRDWALFAYCTVISLIILTILGTILFASLVKVWPYDFSLSLRHFRFEGVGGGYAAYWNSVRMAFYTAIFGTMVVFGTAYLIEKSRGIVWLRSATYFISMLPVALPGLVLGLAYIFFFNQPTWKIANLDLANPFNALYGTMAILVISNIVHFYTVSFLTATTALKGIDGEFEAVAQSMSVPFYKTFWRVTLPLSLPALLEIGIYYFVNAMVTVSAVIFLYAPSLKLASVAIVNMDDAGDVAAAAAMSMLIVVTALGVRIVYGLITAGLQRRTQAWRVTRR